MKASFSPVSLKNQVYQNIIDMICDGRLGTDIMITEKQMIDHFQVSKAPVREALIQLCSEDVLRSIPRHGYQVVKIDSKTIQDLIMLRQYLELSNLPIAMESMTSERLMELKRLNEQRLEPSAGKTTSAAWNRNRDFHMTLIRYGGNAQVEKAMSSTLAACNRAYAQIYNQKRSIIAPASRNFHDLIVQAIEQHDVFEAHRFLKEDILFMNAWIIDGDQ
ncbi:MAG: GntR family transcriptional regulator [Clostridia bacterium]|nr:GntR family transcriptional regulator [Clostridia bacterium]